jgi:hypothetical protein
MEALLSEDFWSQLGNNGARKGPGAKESETDSVNSGAGAQGAQGAWLNRVTCVCLPP